MIAALRGSVAVNTARGPGGEGATRDGPLRVEAAWILAFLTAKENETASVLVAAGMVPALVEALVDSGGQVTDPRPSTYHSSLLWEFCILKPYEWASLKMLLGTN